MNQTQGTQFPVTADDIAARAYDLLEDGRTYSSAELMANREEALRQLIAEGAVIPYPTTVTVHEGHQVRVVAQTASRDYTGTAVPGTYPIRYTDVHGNPVAEGKRPYYARVTLEIDSPERRESTVEFGGVTIASQRVVASRDTYTHQWYAYQVEGKTPDSATLTFNFDAETVGA